jgi:hypothetical protein
VGVVTVKAQDFAAAQVMAARRVEWAVDLVNCFADLIPYNYGWMYLAGEAGKARQVTPMINIVGSTSLSHRRHKRRKLTGAVGALG